MGKKKLALFFEKNAMIWLILLFSAISSACMYLKSDDFLWFYVNSDARLENYKAPNGRYFSNMLTYFLVRHDILRFIFVFAVMSIFLLLIARMIDLRKKSTAIACISAIIMLLTIPAETYAQTLNWFSGFTNYIWSLVLTFAYMLLVFRIVFFAYKPPKILIPTMLVTALAGGLCVEHVTVYNILFAAAAMILAKKMRGKIFAVNIAYALGALAAAAIMFINPNYGLIAGGTDNSGNRALEFSLNEAYLRFLNMIMQNYVRPLCLLNVCIFAMIAVIYAKNDGSRFKYGKICFGICLCFAVYSLLTTVFTDIAVVSAEMKLKSLECSLNLLYLVSLAYLFVKLLPKESAIRSCIYLVSTVAVTMPFVVLSPCTARCFLADYAFWILLCGELIFAALSGEKFFTCAGLAKAGTLAAAAVCVFIGGIDIMNCSYNNIRVEYFREQSRGKRKSIYILDVPYPDYQYQFELEFFFDNALKSEMGDFSYGELFFMYYDIPTDNIGNYKKVSMIDPQNYNL